MKNSWKKRVRIQIALQRNPHGCNFCGNCYWVMGSEQDCRYPGEYRIFFTEAIPGLRGICREYGEDGFGEAWLNRTGSFMIEGFSRLRQERLLQRKGMKKVIVIVRPGVFV